MVIFNSKGKPLGANNQIVSFLSLVCFCNFIGPWWQHLW